MQNDIQQNNLESEDSTTEQSPPKPRAEFLQPDAVDDTERLHWELICPPDNWEEPLPVSLAELRLLELLSLRLDLVMSRDDKRRKVYLSTARVNGDVDSSEPHTDQKGSSSGGLRYPSRWTADVIPFEEAGPGYEAVDVEAAAPLIPAFPDAQVSKNFRLSEFRPGEHSYDLIRLSPMLVNVLEEIREKAGGLPLNITSAYRPRAYNRKVGGVSNSTHIDGLAADIYCDHLSVDQLHEICERVVGDLGGVGFYPRQGFVHIDIRGYRARW